MPTYFNSSHNANGQDTHAHARHVHKHTRVYGYLATTFKGAKPPKQEQNANLGRSGQ